MAVGEGGSTFSLFTFSGVNECRTNEICVSDICVCDLHDDDSSRANDQQQGFGSGMETKRECYQLDCWTRDDAWTALCMKPAVARDEHKNLRLIVDFKLLDARSTT